MATMVWSQLNHATKNVLRSVPVAVQIIGVKSSPPSIVSAKGDSSPGSGTNTEDRARPVPPTLWCPATPDIGLKEYASLNPAAVRQDKSASHTASNKAA